MKKIYLMSLVALCSAFTMTSCVNEEDDIFSSSAANRLTEVTEKLYPERLASSENGWLMYYYPKTGTDAITGDGYLVLADFNADGSVRVGMNNIFTGNNYQEATSLWDIIKDDGPVLSFSTYNKCMHAFSAPEDLPFTTGAREDETGSGAEGDYEFIMIDVPENPDSIMLKGKKRGTYIYLDKLDAGVDYKSYLDDVTAKETELFPPQISKKGYKESVPNTLVLTLQDQTFKMDSMYTHRPNIYKYDGDYIADGTLHPCLFAKHHNQYCIRFKDALECPDGKKVQVFYYDEATQQFNGFGVEGCTITGQNPVNFFVDYINAGKSWVLNTNSEKSEAFDSQYSQLVSDFRAASRRMLSTVTFMLDDEKSSAIQFTYRDKTGKTKKAYFKVNIVNNGGNVSIAYVDASDNNARDIYGEVASLPNFLNTICTTLNVSAAVNKLKLNNLKLTSASNDAVWFNVTNNI